MPDPNRTFAPPSPSSTKVVPKPNRLSSPEKEKAYQDILAHFSMPDYQVTWIKTPVGTAPYKGVERQSKEKEKSGLTDEERCFLVSFLI